ncbi:uridine diphosphate-N-acetylglucosamine-binding protein YvcK [Pueribacillus sp. YX66]|uniref:gluconeogenesis factor YvcK family protein n=1 Tax=Pueribacillus sp. YX66 TaxID=3229242 RepID=UPI00358D0E03
MNTEKMRKVVVIGGGTGLSVLLRGLKTLPLDLAAIVTVADDGGSSGRLRDELNIPPPGDIRNVLLALSEAEPLFNALMQHRFKNGNGLSGHALGNLIIAAMTDITGDFFKAITEFSRVLNVKGKVLPASNQSIVLNATMSDGTIVTGESKIPLSEKKIKRVFLTPNHIKPLPETLKAIAESDLIVLGPGSLYTSILPNLLVPGIADAIKKAKAKKVYICNVMTQQGETDSYCASDHVQALTAHVGNTLVDTIIVNDAPIPEDIAALYALEGAKPVKCDLDRLKSSGYDIINGTFIQYDNNLIRHDMNKVSNVLLSLIT